MAFSIRWNQALSVNLAYCDFRHFFHRALVSSMVRGLTVVMSEARPKPRLQDSSRSKIDQYEDSTRRGPRSYLFGLNIILVNTQSCFWSWSCIFAWPRAKLQDCKIATPRLQEQDQFDKKIVLLDGFELTQGNRILCRKIMENW